VYIRELEIIRLNLIVEFNAISTSF